MISAGTTDRRQNKNDIRAQPLPLLPPTPLPMGEDSEVVNIVMVTEGNRSSYTCGVADHFFHQYLTMCLRIRML
jgi:hypothetical protein